MANCPWNFNYCVFCNGWAYEHIGCLLMEAALFFAVGVVGASICAYILGYMTSDVTYSRREHKRLEAEDKAMEPYRGHGTGEV